MGRSLLVPLVAALAASALADINLFNFGNLVDIDGKNVSLSPYKGNVTLVINVASFWGETSMSYTGMSKLYTRYADKPFTILAFPCNQFGHQEPKSNSWIESFVRGKGSHKCGLIYCNWKGYFPYPLFAKTTVKPNWCAPTGSPSQCSPSSTDCCPQNNGLWQWLLNITGGNNPPKWNFAGKHLFDKCGNHVKYINDETLDPYDLHPQIDDLLSKDC